MNYRVFWNEHVAMLLEKIYDSSLDKEGLTNAVTRIGLELSIGPLFAGESRDENERILFKFPLIVWFEVNERMKEVVIYYVRASRRWH